MLIDLDGRKLLGLHVAAASFGIRAIRPIFEYGPGRWAGDSNLNETVCEKLTTNIGVKEFSGHFDVCLPL